MALPDTPYYNYSVCHKARTRRVFKWQVFCLSCRKLEQKAARKAKRTWETLSLSMEKCDRCGNPPTPQPRNSMPKRQYRDVLRIISYMQPCELDDKGIPIIP